MRQFQPVLLKKNGTAVIYAPMSAKKCYKVMDNYALFSYCITDGANGAKEKLTKQELKELTFL